MSLAELIQGKRDINNKRTATAILAKVARVPANLGDIDPEIARIATIAIASNSEEVIDPRPFLCTAPKVGGRICGSNMYRVGVSGFISCADPACQVPFIPELPILLQRCIKGNSTQPGGSSSSGD